MDKIVDHLFVFEGEGEIGEYWGSYTDYRNTKDEGNISLVAEQKEKEAMKETQAELLVGKKTGRKRLGYIEQREFDRLGQEIEDLEEKKDSINQQFQDPDTPYDDIKKLGDDMKKVVAALEDKEMRWLELLAKVTD